MAEEGREDPLPRRDEVLNFLESESSRADSSHRYLIALVSLGIVGTFYLFRSIPVIYVRVSPDYIILAGTGAGLYLLFGSRLASRFVDVLLPRRMIYLASPVEASVVQKWLEVYGIPRAWRLFSAVDASSYLLYSISLFFALNNGYGIKFILIGSLIFSIPTAFLKSFGTFSRKRLIKYYYSIIRVAIWERLADSTDDTTTNRYVEEVKSEVKGSFFAPTRENAKIWLFMFNFMDKIGALFPFIIHLVAVCSVIVDLYSGRLLNIPLSLDHQIYFIFLVSLLYVVLFGSLWVYLDPFRAQLGQLRLYVLIDKQGAKHAPLLFVGLEALREMRIFYPLPLEAFIPAVQEAQDAPRPESEVEGDA